MVQVKGAAVESVTMEDLLSVNPSPTSTYIIKTDIEGYDCKVFYIICIMKRRFEMLAL